jgi:excisionase family DNA binding protein
MSNEKDDRLTMTVPEAGQCLGLGRAASYEAAKRGELPVIKIGKRLLVPRGAIERMLAEVKPARSTQPDEKV